ncbi:MULTISPECIES: DUF7289 family protein [Salinibaculum]|uniref:DUF7289 family protein n=1 Tax=Salinibaculum TaxID=2732368 RepID=UPI0030CCE88F
MTTPAPTADRGISTVVGFVLMVGMVIAGVSITLAIGTIALTDVQDQVGADRASNSMAQLDSQVSQVALGDSPTQQIRLGGGDGGTVRVDDDAGRIQLASISETGTETLLLNKTYGAIEYEVGETVVAYQGGGVWRHQDDYTQMVSVPEYHYRNGTLTFPIIRVTGVDQTSSATSPLTVRENGTTLIYPNESQNRENPLTTQKVQVTVTSEYHDGWYEYFSDRNEGSVVHDPGNETVSVTLTVPVKERFNYAVAATAENGDPVESGPSGQIVGPITEGVDRPSPDREIEQRIDECKAGGCTDLSTALNDDSLENGTYFADGDRTIDSGTEFDTANGDVTVVVNGSVTFKGCLVLRPVEEGFRRSLGDIPTHSP